MSSTKLRVPWLCVLVPLLLITFSSTAWAAWPHDPLLNFPVCTSADDQNLPHSVPDGAGGVILAWQDSRSGTSDIYAQRISASGVPLWTKDGVSVCTATGNQDNLRIVSDGSGGAIITWMDYRSGESDIYAQRIDPSGTALWTSDGIVVCNAGAAQRLLSEQRPAMVTDGAGGAIIVWEDYRGGYPPYMRPYAQRISSTGAALWIPNGVAVTSLTNYQSGPSIGMDGSGGAIVTWSSWQGATDYDTYAQRIDAAGVLQWGAAGVPVCGAASHQYFEVSIPDGSGGAVFTWEDFRSGNWDIYAQHLNGAGIAQWPVNGVAVAVTAGDQMHPCIITDGSGGAILMWDDRRSGGYDIYAQRLDAAGAPQWAVNGVVVSTTSGERYIPTMISDGCGGGIAVWSDRRSGDYDVYAQRVSGSGLPQWTADGVALCTAVDDQLWAGDWVFAALTSDGHGGAIVAWHDHRSGNWDIYAQNVDSLGILGVPQPTISGVQDVPMDQGGKVMVLWQSSNLDVAPQYDIDSYTLWRRITASAAMQALDEGKKFLADRKFDRPGSDAGDIRVTCEGGNYLYWEFITSMHAYGFMGYAFMADTPSDSMAGWLPYNVFMVIANEESGSGFYASDPDSGYSVDNLSPCTPAGLGGEYRFSPARILISWNPNGERDLSHYAVYKGSDEDFVPGPGNRIGTPADTFYVDEGVSPPAAGYYKVSACDVHGNESGYTLLRPEEITDVSLPSRVPVATVLKQNVPNPFNPITVIRFDLAERGRASLIVYDVAGRLVRTLVDGDLGAGRHEITWDGRDDSGTAVASGVYLYQLRAPGYAESKRMVLLR